MMTKTKEKKVAPSFYDRYQAWLMQRMNVAAAKGRQKRAKAGEKAKGS